MSSLHKFLIGSALLVVASLASAADPVAPNAAQSVSRAGVSAEQATRSRLIAHAVPRANAIKAKELVANSYRAYPASCLSDPLPTSTSGVLFGGTVTLYAFNNNDSTGNPQGLCSGDLCTEDVTITIWRVSCSSSGADLTYNPDGGPVSATLMRIQRNAASVNANGHGDGDSTFYPMFPGVRIAQGSIVFDNHDYTDYVRVPPEPNTVVSDTTIDTPIIDSETFALENYPVPSLGYFYFNNAFQIRFDNFFKDASGNPIGQVVFDVDAYNPTSATYPAAYNPLPINGYMTGAWYDSTHSGEGILTQVLETASNRLFVLTWYTFDQAGIPFWISASGAFNIGDNQVLNMPAAYVTGGGFAGGFTPPVTNNSWGTVSVYFTDCNSMTFSYTGSTPSVTGGPGGVGTKTWSRIGNINSLTCE